jgi:hypothetical protein
MCGNSDSRHFPLGPGCKGEDGQRAVVSLERARVPAASSVAYDLFDLLLTARRTLENAWKGCESGRRRAEERATAASRSDRRPPRVERKKRPLSRRLHRRFRCLTSGHAVLPSGRCSRCGPEDG